ncbi:MAG TPA: hypothetical protein VFC21_12125 [Bryobacteraceae bacterium]|nr:hypothetical protein [Bryobacteraceae bacterium]
MSTTSAKDRLGSFSEPRAQAFASATAASSGAAMASGPREHRRSSSPGSPSNTAVLPVKFNGKSMGALRVRPEQTCAAMRGRRIRENNVAIKLSK